MFQVALPATSTTMAEEKLTNQTQESQSSNNQPSQENVPQQHQTMINNQLLHTQPSDLLQQFLPA